MNKLFFTLVTLLFVSELVFSQYNLAVGWNIYEPGMVVDEEPFNGGFTIINYGEISIPANDTLWYGYKIGGLVFDINLNPDMYSGTVLTEDFEPYDELSIFNWFGWPEWGAGIEIEVCAVVYGAGYESYTGDIFTGDFNISNNTTCLTAILPGHTSGIDEVFAEKVTMTAFGNELRINSFFEESITDTDLKVFSITGQLILDVVIELSPGENKINTDFRGNGLYLVQLQFDSKTIVTKVIF